MALLDVEISDLIVVILAPVSGTPTAGLVNDNITLCSTSNPCDSTGDAANVVQAKTSLTAK